MKVALVHDHLVQMGGAENVLRVFQNMFKSAPTYTLFFDRNRVGRNFSEKDIRTSFLQNLPLGKKKYQWYLPLMPMATEQHDLSCYKLVLSSSSAFSKGVITGPDCLHICYCHTPTRYLWSDTHSYVQNLPYPRIIKSYIPKVLSKLRIWDRLAADRVDFFIANSQTVKRRIKKYYNRESDVIYPPVSLSKFVCKTRPGGKYFLTGGRLVSYKKFDITIKAFNRLNMPLKVFGVGPELANLKKMARKNIEFLGFVDDQTRTALFQEAKAFIHPQIEDFGITPVESMASGTPVIAYAKGGAKETVIAGRTGLFFNEQRWEEIADLVIRFKDEMFDPKTIHQYSQKFSEQSFQEQISDYIYNKLKEFNQ